jgi:NAD(P)-dependent dehydrogenase (short-subunit alcohol dehydrogenase family)
MGGIGRETAKAFVAEGASVLLADLDREAGERFAAEVTRDTGRVVMQVADVTKAEEAEGVVARALKEFGRLDVLINSVSWDKVDILTEATEEDFDRQMATLGKSYWLMARAAMPHFIRGGGGSIIQFASMQAYRALPGRAALQMAKGAVTSLTRELALEYGPAGVRVNSILPGLVLHEKGWAMYRNPQDPTRFASHEELELRRQCYPLRRFGTPEEIAPACVFLASDESKWMTGADLVIDGGASIQLAEALVFPPFRRLWRKAAPAAWDATWTVDLP